jgi:hypothetical protein
MIAIKLIRLVTLISLLGFSSLSMALPIGPLPTTTLTGDVRYPNLDDLSVRVDITLAGAVARWTVNLDTLINPLDSGAKLHAFFFNLDLDGKTFSLSNQPSDWVVNSGNNAEGSGGADFDFKLEDDNGPPKTDVIIGSPLTFDLTLNSGSWTSAMFTGASITDDGAVQDGQLGAHIGGLRRGCSAFVVGTYGESPDPTASTSDSEYCGSGSTVPEPSIIALFGLGLLGLGFARRRRTHN